MGLKVSLVSWYIRNILMPKAEDINNPGYIITKLSKDGPVAYLRDVMLPEAFVVKLENRIVDEYGDMGKKVLYSAGKKAGYVYAYLSDLARINNTSEKSFSDFTEYFMTYIAGTMASEATRKLDVKSKSITIKLTDFIVCSKNGHGHMFTEGVLAGLWAFLICDNTVEGAHVYCQGNKNNECKLVCAPPRLLEELKLHYFIETDLLESYPISEYRSLNALRPAKYAKSSLRQLLDGGFFKYVDNKISFSGDRYFECDTHFVYSLEQELSKLDKGDEILFEVAFEFWQGLVSKIKNQSKGTFMADYVSALGWGDLLVTDKGITSFGYPWTIYSKDSKFIMFRGMISGLMSGFIGEEMKFDLKNKIITGGHFDVEFTAKKN